MSKFENELTERAYAVAGDGFAERELGSVDELGWYAQVVIDGKTVGLVEDCSGFVYSEVYEYQWRAEQVWTTVENNYDYFYERDKRGGLL